MKKQAMSGKSRWGGLVFIAAVIMGVLLTACAREEKQELYHRFTDRIWARFNILKFEVPIEKPASYDVSLFANFAKDYPHDLLELNMIMTTSSGEERIREYQMPVKSPAGDFCIPCVQDSCTGTVLLKRSLFLTKPGILNIEIENLTPRLSTTGILGVGVRITPSTQ